MLLPTCAPQRDDGFVEVFQQPVEQHEVAAALGNLCSAGGGMVIACRWVDVPTCTFDCCFCHWLVLPCIDIHLALDVYRRPPPAMLHIEEIEATSDSSRWAQLSVHLAARLQPCIRGPARSPLTIRCCSPIMCYSEGSVANHLMESVDELNPFFAAGG